MFIGTMMMSTLVAFAIWASFGMAVHGIMSLMTNLQPCSSSDSVNDKTPLHRVACCLAKCGCPCAKACASKAKANEFNAKSKVPRTAAKEPSERAVSSEGGRVSDMSLCSSTYSLTVEVPGLRQDDLSVSSDNGVLLIRGSTAIGTTTYTVNRAYHFPEDANIDEATSEHRDGVLIFTVPKQVATKKVGCAATDKPDEASTCSAAAPSKLSDDTSTVYRQAPPGEPNVRNSEEKVGDVNTASAGAGTTRVIDFDSSEEFETIPAQISLQNWQSEWEPLADDLYEMGFHEVEDNRATLAKYAGSVKLAVKDLVRRRACSVQKTA